MDLINIQFQRLFVLRHAHRRNNSHGMAHIHHDGHDTIAGMRFVGAGDISAVQQQTFDLSGNEAAQGNGVGLRLLERLVFGNRVQSGAFHIVQIEEEVGLGDHPVIEYSGLRDIVFVALPTLSRTLLQLLASQLPVFLPCYA